MKILALAMLLGLPACLWAGVAERMYEGPTGLTCLAWNKGARIRWQRPGGDWLDRSGIRHGTRAFGRAAIADNQRGVVSIDATGAGNRLFVRSSALVRFHSRESSFGGPRLILTLADGAKRTLRPRADSTITCSTRIRSLGLSQRLGPDFVIDFPSLPPHRSARLELSIEEAFRDGVASVFKLRPPVFALPPVSTGFARNYPDDRGICNDPDVVYCQDWDSDPVNWWKGTGFEGQQRKRISNGVPFNSQRIHTHYEPNGGVIGAGLRHHHTDGDLSTTMGAPTVGFYRLPIGEQETMYYRYYVRFGLNFRDAKACDGGKLPGFAGGVETGLGHSGSRANGLNAWSMRGQYLMNCDRANPIYPRVVIGTYAYHVQQAGSFGSHWAWSGHGDAALARLGTWQCLEARMSVNTPGRQDGRFQGWINGRLVLDRRDIWWRDVKPALGYGDWMPRDESQPGPRHFSEALGREFYLRTGRLLDRSRDLMIDRFWGVHHHGGTRPFGKEADVWIDQIVIARSRVGCIERP